MLWFSVFIDHQIKTAVLFAVQGPTSESRFSENSEFVKSEIRGNSGFSIPVRETT